MIGFKLMMLELENMILEMISHLDILYFCYIIN